MLVAYWLHKFFSHTLRKEQIFFNFRITCYLAEILTACLSKLPSECVTLTRALFSCQLYCWDNCNLIAEDINQDYFKNFHTQASLRKLLQESYNLFIRKMVTSLNNMIRDFCQGYILYSTFLSQRRRGLVLLELTNNLFRSSQHKFTAGVLMSL